MKLRVQDLEIISLILCLLFVFAEPPKPLFVLLFNGMQHIFELHCGYSEYTFILLY